jgi:hypothetical protein
VPFSAVKVPTAQGVQTELPSEIANCMKNEEKRQERKNLKEGRDHSTEKQKHNEPSQFDKSCRWLLRACPGTDQEGSSNTPERHLPSDS